MTCATCTAPLPADPGEPRPETESEIRTRLLGGWRSYTSKSLSAFLRGLLPETRQFDEQLRQIEDEVYQAALVDHVPGCYHTMDLDEDYLTCSCGWDEQHSPLDWTGHTEGVRLADDTETVYAAAVARRIAELR